MCTQLTHTGIQSLASLACSQGILIINCFGPSFSFSSPSAVSSRRTPAGSQKTRSHKAVTKRTSKVTGQILARKLPEPDRRSISYITLPHTNSGRTHGKRLPPTEAKFATRNITKETAPLVAHNKSTRKTRQNKLCNRHYKKKKIERHRRRRRRMQTNRNKVGDCYAAIGRPTRTANISNHNNTYRS